jgi:hypothetical protein
MTPVSDYADPIVRLYDTVFHRAPDATGLQFWDNSLRQGYSLHDIAGQFVTAPEFAATYGQPDSTSFVQSMYHNVLGRGGEADGASFWAYNLDHGLTDRAEIVVAFSESAEHIAHLAAPAAVAAPVSQNPASPDAGFVPMHPSGPAPTTGPTVAHHEGPHNDPAPAPAPAPDVSHPVLGQIGQKDGPYVWTGDEWSISGTEGPDVLTPHVGNNNMSGNGGDDTITGGPGYDVLIGGKGNDVLTGGPGNDIFVFRPGDGGDTITDFQHGDRILFTSGITHVEDVFTSAFENGPLYLVYNKMQEGEGSIHLEGLTQADASWVRDSFMLA